MRIAFLTSTPPWRAREYTYTYTVLPDPFEDTRIYQKRRLRHCHCESISDSLSLFVGSCQFSCSSYAIRTFAHFALDTIANVGKNREMKCVAMQLINLSTSLSEERFCQINCQKQRKVCHEDFIPCAGER